MPSAKSQHDSPVAVYGALAANLGIAVAKLVAAALTGSSAMISEGIHSIVDTGNQGLLLVGIRRSRRPADELHQFGHGKELYFWSLVVAIVLFGVGGGLAFYEGIQHVLDPHPIADATVNYVVLVRRPRARGHFMVDRLSRDISRRRGGAGCGRPCCTARTPRS